ncbi:MAG: YceI family protein [Saprospiraceae bacterium]|nr:YceI family protein [Saprospiraceae bacterium]MBK7810204.1 YceI family protein [Saprospiraceae bacterium]MBK9629808.1 YceI family protein [Saprospiraceae bacterium]
MKYLIAAYFALLIVSSLDAQKYFSKNASIRFYSDTPFEKIEGINSSASTVLDASTGQLEFAVLIKGFQFDKALLEEHFNENYMESSKFPKSTFKGMIENPSAVDWSKHGVKKVNVKGKLTIHGVTKEVTIPSEFVVGPEGIKAKSKFNVKPQDYDIKIPSVVRDKIANEIEVNIQSNYQLLNQ